MASQTEIREILELIITPTPPDNVASVKEGILPYIEEALKEKGRDGLLSKKEIQLEVEKTFPTDEVIIIVVTMLSDMALVTFKEIVLPILKKRYKVWQKSRKKDS